MTPTDSDIGCTVYFDRHYATLLAIDGQWCWCECYAGRVWVEVERVRK